MFEASYFSAFEVSFTEAFSLLILKARQSLVVRGLSPMVVDPRHPAESLSTTNVSVLKVAFDHRKTSSSSTINASIAA